LTEAGGGQLTHFVCENKMKGEQKMKDVKKKEERGKIIRK
jgi:hypothetical protein